MPLSDRGSNDPIGLLPNGELNFVSELSCVWNMEEEEFDEDGADPAMSGKPNVNVRPVVDAYDPNQPRDPGGEGGGQWVKGPGTSSEEHNATHLAELPEDVQDWHREMGAVAKDYGFKEIGTSLNAGMDHKMYRNAEGERLHMYPTHEGERTFKIAHFSPEGRQTGNIEGTPEALRAFLDDHKRRFRTEDARKGYDPNQPRDPGGEGGGQWIAGAPDDNDIGDFTRHDIEPDMDYIYHGSNGDNVRDIWASSLETFPPDHGTDQDAWPDGGTEDRSYWTATPDVARSFYAEGGKPALLRVARSRVKVRKESGTTDLYLREAVAPHDLEYFGADGNWHQLKRND